VGAGNAYNVADMACRRRPKKYESPQSTPVAVAQPHALEAVAHRTPTRINSFRYFVQELVALPDPSKRAWRKKQLEKIIRRIRENAVGRADYSAGDFVKDVKCACAREAVPLVTSASRRA